MSIKLTNEKIKKLNYGGVFFLCENLETQKGRNNRDEREEKAQLEQRCVHIILSFKHLCTHQFNG